MTTLQPRLTKAQEEFLDEVGCSSYQEYLDHLEIKAWIHADFLRELDEMGYSSYQEYLDAMEHEEMMDNACFPDPN